MHLVTRLVLTIALAGVSCGALADGSSRRVDDVSTRHSLRVHAEPSETQRERYPLRTRRDATPRGIGAHAGETAVERRDAPAGVERRTRAEGSIRAEAPRSLRAKSAPGEIAVVDKPYAPESLLEMMETEEDSRGAGVLFRAEREALLEEVDARSLRDLGAHREIGVESHRRDVLDRHSVIDTEHLEVHQDIDSEQVRRELRHHVVEAHTGAVDVPLRTNSLRIVPEVDRITDSLSTRRGNSATELRTDRDVSQLSRVGAAYRSESLETRARLGEEVVVGEAPTLTASARLNESIGTANTFVVLSVQNTGQATVASPVVRLALPEGVKYEGLAFAPPGTAAAVVDTRTGRAVEVVLPLRVPSGHESRVMVYLSPRDAVRVGDLEVQAFPQGQAPLRGVTTSEATVVPTQVESAVTSGESKDP